MTMRVLSLCLVACLAATSVLAQGTVNFYQVQSIDLASTSDPSCSDCQSVFICTMETDTGVTLVQGNFGGLGQFKGDLNATTGEVGAYFLATDGSSGGLEFNMTSWIPEIGAYNASAPVGQQWVAPAATAVKWGQWTTVVKEEPALNIGEAAAKCLLSMGEPQVEAIIAKYPDAVTGSVTGKVFITQTNEPFQMTVRYDLVGLTPSSTGGLHIHTGETCSVAAQVGAHYWQPTSQADPWGSNTMWTSDAQGNAKGSFNVQPGFGLLLAQKHALVVHQSTTGIRIGCGVLAMTAVTNFQTAPFNGVFVRNPMKFAQTNLLCGSATQGVGQGPTPAVQPTPANGQYEYTYFGGCTNCCYKPNAVLAPGQVETGTLTGSEWLVGPHPMWSGYWQATTGPLADEDFCGHQVMGTQISTIDFREAFTLGPVLRSSWCDMDQVSGKRLACYFNSAILTAEPQQTECNAFPVGRYNLGALQAQSKNLVQQNVDLFTYFSAQE